MTLGGQDKFGIREIDNCAVCTGVSNVLFYILNFQMKWFFSCISDTWSRHRQALGTRRSALLSPCPSDKAWSVTIWLDFLYNFYPTRLSFSKGQLDQRTHLTCHPKYPDSFDLLQFMFGYFLNINYLLNYFDYQITPMTRRVIPKHHHFILISYYLAYQGWEEDSYKLPPAQEKLSLPNWSSELNLHLTKLKNAPIQSNATIIEKTSS